MLLLRARQGKSDRRFCGGSSVPRLSHPKKSLSRKSAGGQTFRSTFPYSELARGLQSCAPSAPAPSVVPYGRGLILAAPFSPAERMLPCRD